MGMSLFKTKHYANVSLFELLLILLRKVTKNFLLKSLLPGEFTACSSVGMNYGSYVLSNSFWNIFPILFEILPGFQGRATMSLIHLVFLLLLSKSKSITWTTPPGYLPEFPKIFTCASHVRDLTEVLTISSGRLSKKPPFLHQFTVSGSQCSSPLSPDTSHGVLKLENVQEKRCSFLPWHVLKCACPEEVLQPCLGECTSANGPMSPRKDGKSLLFMPPSLQ